MKRWRNLVVHRAAQAKGRNEFFSNYRLRIASVLRDYGMNERAEAPEDSQAVHAGCATRQFNTRSSAKAGTQS